MVNKLHDASSHPHIPVLLHEVVEWANLKPGGICIDATVGFGGHAAALIPRIMQGGRYIGIDKDERAISAARPRLRGFGEAVMLLQARFSEIERVARENEVGKADCILFDLGVSSPQLDDPAYGISFASEGNLDMRIGMNSTLTAREIINHWSAQLLDQLFTQHGQAAVHRLVRAISAERQIRPIDTVEQLRVIIDRTVPKAPGIHPATGVFQALRVAVNDEEGELNRGLEQAVTLLKDGGRLLVISFHSGEDRLVKNFLRNERDGCICPSEFPVCQCGHHPRVKILTSKPIVPGATEVGQNPRSRSAKMRVAERVEVRS